MFKAAFPYAQVEEENAEKDYIKSLPAASSEEVAGNVWIQPDEALSLADEYGIRYWIEALLDPEPITHGTNDTAKAIQSPPPFRAREMEVEEVNGADKTPEKKFEGRRSTRRGGSVSVRSESPTKESKIKTPARKIATPRTKRGRGRPALGSVDEGRASLEPESVNGDAYKHEETSSRPTSRRETVKIEVETTTTELPGNDEEVERTKVNIEMPTGHPDLELPNDAEAMLEKARQMVREANSINGPTTTSSKVSKRKAEEMIEADDEVGLEGPTTRATKSRKMEVELRKERIRRRAMAGIAATLFIGAFVPTLATAFSWV
nr:hypothetical protein CFP56_72051 [Quercus suber]